MKACLSLCVLAAVLAGCGGSDSTTSSDDLTGRARLSLSGIGSDGYTYSIVGYSLRFEGPQSLVVGESPDETIWLTLRTGHYTVALEGDWHVERTDVPGVPVDVELVSPNPLAFAVRDNEETPVRFIFKLPSEGNAAVTIGVDAGGWISGTFQIAGADDPNATHAFDPLLGVPVPFTISWQDARITRDPLHTSIVASYPAVQFGGTASAILDEFALALSSSQVYIELYSIEDGVLVTMNPLMGYLGSLGYDFTMIAPTPVPGSLDEDGAPQLGSYVVPDAQLWLTRGSASATAIAPITVVAR